MLYIALDRLRKTCARAFPQTPLQYASWLATLTMQTPPEYFHGSLPNGAGIWCPRDSTGSHVYIGIAIAEGSNTKQRLICKEGMHTVVMFGPATLVFRYSAWPERLLAILPVQCLAWSV